MMDLQEKYSKIITDFLESHPAISANKIEQDLALPQSTLYKAKNGREIAIKHIYPLLCYLADYGLTIDGYTLTLDKDTDSLFARKWISNEGQDRQGNYKVKEARWMACSYADLF